MKKSKEPNLFGNLDELAVWNKEWQNMPEFVQDDERPIQQIIVSFKKQEDVRAFAELIQQKLTYKTKSVWFPQLIEEKPSNFLYVDESEKTEE